MRNQKEKDKVALDNQKTQPPKKKKRRTLRNSIIILGVFLGVLLIGGNFIIPFYYNHFPTKITKVKGTPIFEDRPPRKATMQNIIEAQSDPKPPAAGYFVIPSIAIHLPIYSGIGYNTMLYGVGEQYPETTIKAGDVGNYVVASHLDFWTDYLFGKLPSIDIGAKVYVSDSTKVYEYTVYSKIAVSPTEAANYIYDTTGKKENQRLITMYTCTDMDSDGRWIVRGRVTNEWSLLSAPKEVKSDFDTWINAPY